MSPEKPKTTFRVLRELGYKPGQSRELLIALHKAGLTVRRFDNPKFQAAWALVEMLDRHDLAIVEIEREPADSFAMAEQLCADMDDKTECEKCGEPFDPPRPISMLAGYCGGDFCQHDPAYLTGD